MFLLKKYFDLISRQAYAALKVILVKNHWLVRLVQILRRIILVGPINHVIVQYHQKYRKNKAVEINHIPFFPKLDVDRVVRSLNKLGYSQGSTLPEETIGEILKFCKKNNENEDYRHWNPHLECDTIHQIAHNEKIIQIARNYFGIEPILWQTELKLSFPKVPKESIKEDPADNKLAQYGENVFHNDLLDCKSMTVFVYLSDVDLDSGPHVIIEGTHKNKSLMELTRLVLNDDEAHERYGERINTIVGEKGTLFFEEVSTYHKSLSATRKKKRLILKIDYVLQRKVPSAGFYSILKTV